MCSHSLQPSPGWGESHVLLPGTLTKCPLKSLPLQLASIFFQARKWVTIQKQESLAQKIFFEIYFKFKDHSEWTLFSLFLHFLVTSLLWDTGSLISRRKNDEVQMDLYSHRKKKSLLISSVNPDTMFYGWEYQVLLRLTNLFILTQFSKSRLDSQIYIYLPQSLALNHHIYPIFIAKKPTFKEINWFIQHHTIKTLLSQN